LRFPLFLQLHPYILALASFLKQGEIAVTFGSDEKSGFLVFHRWAAAMLGLAAPLNFFLLFILMPPIHRPIFLLFAVVALGLLAGCSSPPNVSQRSAKAQHLAGLKGWQQSTIDTELFNLTSYGPSPGLAPSKTLHVYIEGDGLAWLDRDRPSSNPTPLKPLALELALRDPAPSVYLARPCQFTTSPACDDRRWWKEARFAPEVIAATSHALDVLKIRYQAEQLVLFGYSGGGAVAMLAASTRRDIAMVVTIAGNLDIAAWAKHQRISPLRDSLNPADKAKALASTAQLHLVGAADIIVPASLTLEYAARLPASHRPGIRVIEGYDHHCCWVQGWQDIMASIPKSGT
jgi:pimeloyl-ACP methyl ester carboxylesterase